MENRLVRAVGTGSMIGAGTGAVAGSVLSGSGNKQTSTGKATRQRRNTSLGSRAGSAVGAVLDTKNKVKDNATAVRENIKDMPTQTAYAVHSAKEKAKESVSDFKRGVVQGQETRQSERAEKLQKHRDNIAGKRMEMQKAQEARQRSRDGSATAGASRTHERPVTATSRQSAEKAQEVKRPVTSGKGATDKVHTEPSKAQTVKERPLASGAGQTSRTERTNTRQQTQTASRSTKQTTKKTTSKKGRRK